jgi:hypothetical protein
VNAAPGKDYGRMMDKCKEKNKLVKKQVWLDGAAFWILMLPNPKIEAEESVLLFLTTLPPTEKTAAQYAKRWKIECLFFHLKTNGYNLEDLNLKDPGKNRLMMAIVTSAYILAVREGWKRRRQIPKQVYQNQPQTPQVSIFRKGLEILTAKCFRFIDFLRYVFSILSPKNHAIFKNVQ